MLVLACLVGALNYLNQRGLFYLPETLRQIVIAFDTNATTELASLAITILVVDALYEHRETEREKKRLILQMGSPDNAFAREAVRALRAQKWLYDGSLKTATLWRANLKGAHLEYANLQEADLLSANLQEADLTNANLQEADLVDANLQEATLVGANLREALLWRANLQGANLEHADLQKADLSGADLQEADLVRAKLQEANLADAYLQGAFLEGANLQGTKYNNATKWPEGFTPPPEAINVDAETNGED